MAFEKAIDKGLPEVSAVPQSLLELKFNQQFKKGKKPVVYIHSHSNATYAHFS